MQLIQDPINNSKINNLKVVVSIYHYSGYNERVNLLKIVFNLLTNTKPFIDKTIYVEWFYKELEIMKTLCCVAECTTKRGIFPECKMHFNKAKYQTKGKFVWSPSIKGYETIKSISADYPIVININKVDREINGSMSKIQITCFICDHKWPVNLGDIFVSRCPSCTGTRWCSHRVQQESLKRLDIKFYLVNETCQINGRESHIPIICNKENCNYHEMVDIRRIFNNKHQCVRCSGREIWSLDRLHREAINRPDINFSRVLQKHIDVDKCESLIPVYCNICNYGFDEPWCPRLRTFFDDSKNSSCPRCANCEPWTFKRLKKEIENKPNINFSKVTENHITNGWYSEIPVSCSRCLFEWNSSICKIFSSTYDCPGCDSKYWTMERLNREMINKPNVDFSQVTEKHIINGAMSRIPISCLICFYVWTPTIRNLFATVGCPACTNHIEWTYEMFEIEKLNITCFNYDKVTREHINKAGQSELPLSCVVCNYEFTKPLTTIFSSRLTGCQRCKKNEPWSLEKLNLRKNERPDLNFDKVVEADFNKGHKSLISVKCVICEDEFERTVNRIFNHYCSCLKCAAYKGPKAIVYYMFQNSVKTETEKTFPFLKYINLLNLDIYIQKYPGIKYPLCIEYDGNYPGSHFNNYRNEQEKQSHKQCITRDTIKDNIIIANNMHLLRIPYTAFPSYKQSEMDEALYEGLNYLNTCEEPTLYRVHPETYLLRDNINQ